MLRAWFSPSDHSGIPRTDFPCIQTALADRADLIASLRNQPISTAIAGAGSAVCNCLTPDRCRPIKRRRIHRRVRRRMLTARISTFMQCVIATRIFHEETMQSEDTSLRWFYRQGPTAPLVERCLFMEVRHASRPDLPSNIPRILLRCAAARPCGTCPARRACGSRDRRGAQPRRQRFGQLAQRDHRCHRRRHGRHERRRGGPCRQASTC